ncbi:hypothetical protein HO173_001478 [Letharia columbiana]|uniref:Uncharacterized protein n=1 Tax=Letharia columbiana TaxID=112416 RepID=A0A8H6L9T8_9LECA|nr:uncharacterized protein HO173_001478 [Letharia columbiana]KAF6240805.1 hypothetical protein HO173_001478 [Letharia columbiana]
MHAQLQQAIIPLSTISNCGHSSTLNIAQKNTAIPLPLETNDGKDMVHFTSLPHPLRDQIYNVALINHEPIANHIHLDRYERATRDFDLHPAYALLNYQSLNSEYSARSTQNPLPPQRFPGI